MPKQSSITGFTVSKQDTPKRKREKKKEIDKTEVTSPSQSSPENKKFTVTTRDKNFEDETSKDNREQGRSES